MPEFFQDNGFDDFIRAILASDRCGILRIDPADPIDLLVLKAAPEAQTLIAAYSDIQISFHGCGNEASHGRRGRPDDYIFPHATTIPPGILEAGHGVDRKSPRLNSSY